MKEAIIIAGANGSGKTTFSNQLIEETGYAFLNADNIERTFNEPSSGITKLKAGRIFFHQLDGLISDNQSFILESTLAGHYLKKVIERMKADNYHVKIIYVFLESPEVCIKRIEIRVKQGGHFVPTEDVIRRYYRSKNNFWFMYKSIVDNWELYYNGIQSIDFIASGIEHEYIIENNWLFNDFLKDVDNHGSKTI